MLGYWIMFVVGTLVGYSVSAIIAYLTIYDYQDKDEWKRL